MSKFCVSGICSTILQRRNWQPAGGFVILVAVALVGESYRAAVDRLAVEENPDAPSTPAGMSAKFSQTLFGSSRLNTNAALSILSPVKTASLVIKPAN